MINLTLNLSGWEAFVFSLWIFALGLILGLVIEIRPKSKPEIKEVPEERLVRTRE